MQQRIIGFDLARAYAIFGMFVVNFNFSFGSLAAPTGPMGHFLNVFTGNSTAIFILCAGMGVSLMTNRPAYRPDEQAALKAKVLKRSWFLFAVGLLLYPWWSGDILHFYGGYLHVAAFLLFVPKRYYLWGALLAVAVFHLLLLLIPIGTGWDLTTYRYVDFWTPLGFLRNTLYNGWNSLFPWLSYLLVGMWLGRLNWQQAGTRRKVFGVGLLGFFLIQGLRLLVRQGLFSAFWSNYLMAEYTPAYLPFVLVTIAFALMVIPACMTIADRFPTHWLVVALQKTGQLTLSNYVIHLTLGNLLLAALTGKHYTGLLEDETPTAPAYILAYAAAFYAASVLFSYWWRRRFSHGPLEALMRKISG
ncbi:DUF418 domain-containing protein [Hymenobacter glaciei]